MTEIDHFTADSIEEAKFLCRGAKHRVQKDEPIKRLVVNLLLRHEILR